MEVLSNIFSYAVLIDDFFWSYIGVYIILLSGLYFTIKSKGFQFKVLFDYKSVFENLYKVSKDKTEVGINPFKLYFATVGGMIGLGNIVAVATAVIQGGPGVLFWLWISAFAGMIIKYSDIFLGVKYRRKNDQGGYDGGPMFYLEKAFKTKYIPMIVALLLCLYGVEVFQFKVITESITNTFALDSRIVLATLLLLVLYVGFGEIKRLANVCTVLMPIFMILYILACGWIVLSNYEMLPEIFSNILYCAFNGHAPIYGFLGSTMIMAMHFGVARAVYSGDIGIGYDSVVQSETRAQLPEVQAKMAIFGQLTDTVVCTCSILVILVTGVWYDPSITTSSEYTVKALSMYFPHADLFMTVLFFLAGYTTIVAYFSVGVKSAKYISKRCGKALYLGYAVVAFISTYFVNQDNLILLMSLAAGFLVLFNISGILKLRNEIKFS